MDSSPGARALYAFRGKSEMRSLRKACNARLIAALCVITFGVSFFLFQRVGLDFQQVVIARG